MVNQSRSSTVSPPLVALAGWLLPGAGYLLIGQRGRAIAIGITIITLFIAGLLIAGIRVIEVPGYEPVTGERAMIPVMVAVRDAATGKVSMEPQRVDVTDPDTRRTVKVPLKRWTLTDAPLSEIRDKPWSVPQAMVGPIAIISGACSVAAAAVDPKTLKRNAEGEPIAGTGISYGAQTHARINEIGSLYLSVAGLLNLMAIIDSTWRASQLNEKPARQGESA